MVEYNKNSAGIFNNIAFHVYIYEIDKLRRENWLLKLHTAGAIVEFVF